MRLEGCVDALFVALHCHVEHLLRGAGTGTRTADRGLTLGASIHDIGEIVVPAEILSMPRKLSVPEFGLIKLHPDAGADIKPVTVVSPPAWAARHLDRS